MNDTFERSDLSILKGDFESTWVEIKNKKSKNIVCACIYRHPRSNLDEFHDYMERCLETLSGENKVFILGDFNIDLLKCEKVSSYDKFYNLMTCYGYLPQIINPSRITGSSSTIIDNIYSNCLNYKLKSGNILISLSEHFCQFVSVCKKKPDLKIIIFIKEIMLNLMQSFLEMMYLYKNGTIISLMLTNNLMTSIYVLKGV